MMVTLLLSIAVASLSTILILLIFRERVTRQSARARGSERVRMMRRYAAEVWLRQAMNPSHARSLRPRFSLSFTLIRLAVRRLPKEMSEAEKVRWAREMRADAESLSKWRLRRIRFAFNLWRKGAPEMPVGQDPAAGPARDL